jgi:hypothetical protein
MKRENAQLTPHFDLNELTQTSNTDLQEKNRDLTDEQLSKLLVLARFLEFIRLIIGRPLIVHSGYRCPELNGVTPGTSQTSQHPLCEACDFIGEDMTAETTFNLISCYAPFLKFGQLILETRNNVQWVHISVAGDRPVDRQGQVFKLTTNI